METIKKTFIEITRELNEHNIKPIIYGSLGLYLKLKIEGHVNDIDFIIDKPEEFLICKEILLQKGFEIDPDHERELFKGDLFVSFIDKIEIENLIKEPLKLDTNELDNCIFLNIDISQYQKIYKNGLKNIYRKEKKEKEDTEKIRTIESFHI